MDVLDKSDKKVWYETVGLEDAKSFIKANLSAAARSFIAIGYYLKHIRDQELFREDHYETVWEFAKGEFGISKSTASRYMSMNDRFSKDGNSPLIQEQYKEFGKSQLQEMLSLTDEQIETVTPDITVQKLREMRSPKEIPYFEIEGQLELEEDFPETIPDMPQENQIPLKQSFTMDITELLDEEPEEKTVAISQQEESGLVPELNVDESSCPPYDNHFCRRQEWGDDQEEQEKGRRACAKCWADWKERQKMLNAVKTQQNEKSAAKVQQEELSPIERGCINGLSPHGNCVCCGADGVKCCGQCDEDCNGRCGWIERPVKADKEKEQEAFEEEKLPDEKWNLGDLPQAKEKYVVKLAKAVVNEYGSRMIFRLGGLSGKDAVNMLTGKCGGDIDIGDDVKACAVAEVIEFYSGDIDLGVCSYGKFVTQVQKALEDWKTENKKKKCDEDCNGRCGGLDKQETEQPAPKMEYELRGKYCDAAARKLIESKHEWFAADHMNRVLQVNESEKQLKEQLAGKEAWYFADPCGNGIAHMNLFQDYIQFFDGDSWVGECEWFYLCVAIQGMWNVIAIENIQAELHEKENKPELCKEEPQPEPETDQSSKVVDAEFTEIEKPEAENLTDLQIAQRELERANRLLEKCLRDLPDETNISIRGMKIKVAALASFICDLDDIENPPPKAEQPELPLLKNNDQRAAFVDAYECWPIWIETEETGERYYRYDLADGTSMVVKVYHVNQFDYSMTDRPWEERFTDGYGCHEYYLLKPDKFFWDCKTNRSVLIEKLKEIQKKG